MYIYNGTECKSLLIYWFSFYFILSTTVNLLCSYKSNPKMWSDHKLRKVYRILDIKRRTSPVIQSINDYTVDPFWNSTPLGSLVTEENFRGVQTLLNKNPKKGTLSNEKKKNDNPRWRLERINYSNEKRTGSRGLQWELGKTHWINWLHVICTYLWSTESLWSKP